MILKCAMVAVLAALTFAAPVSADQLSPTDIKKLAPGQYAVSVMGVVNVTVSMRPNGTLVGYVGGEKDKGRWSVRGQKLCVAFEKWIGGKQRCASLSGGNGSYSGGGLHLRRI